MSNDQQQFQKLINDFVTSILSKLELGNLPSEREQALREIILEKIDRRVLTLIVDELSDEKFQELIAKLDNGGLSEEEEQMLFVEASREIPNFSEKFVKALTELGVEMIQDAAELHKAALDQQNQPKSDDAGGEAGTA